MLLWLIAACPAPDPFIDPPESGFDSECEPRLHYVDADGDGLGDPSGFVEVCVGTPGYVTVGGDCDDTDPLRNEDLDEVCDELDNDCDSVVDEYASDREFYYLDEDGDSYAGDWTFACSEPTSAVSVDSIEDCDDTDAEVHPGADEVCDGDDEDCDLKVDEGC